MPTTSPSSKRPSGCPTATSSPPSGPPRGGRGRSPSTRAGFPVPRRSTMAETQKRTYLVLEQDFDEDKQLTLYRDIGEVEAYGPAEAPRLLYDEQVASKLKPIGAGTYHVV